MSKETPLYICPFKGTIFLANLHGASFYLTIDDVADPYISSYGPNGWNNAFYCADIVSKYPIAFREALSLAQKYLSIR